MDFSLSEEQEMLRKSARSFLDKESPKKFVRDMEQDATGYSPAMWQQMAELGWLGLALPAENGGMGGSFLDLTVLLEQLGRTLTPTPFVPTVVCSALPILEHGNAEQKKKFLQPISEGKLICAVAISDPASANGGESNGAVARAAGDHYVLSGTKLFVQDAHVADYVVFSARAAEGLTVFLVDTRSKGIGVTALKTIASDKQCEIVLDNVRVPKEAVLGRVGEGSRIIERIMSLGALAECAIMVGHLQQMLEMSVQYAKERVQFDKPIGTFQAIQHKLANMATDVDGARFVTYRAAWKLSQGLPAENEVSVAKVWVSDASSRVGSDAHQIHGGIGFTVDHDLQLYSRRANAAALAFGDADYHRDRVVSHATF